MLDEKALDERIGRVLDTARALAREAEVTAWASSGRTAYTRFARNEVTTSGDVEESDVGLTVKIGQKTASSSIDQLDDDAIQALVGRTVHLARVAPEDPEAMPVLGPQTYLPVRPEVWDDETGSLGANQRAEAVGAAIAAADAAKVEIAGFYEHSAWRSVTATSAGMRVAWRNTSGSFSNTARTADGTGSGWAGGVGNRVADFDPGALAARAIDKATRSQKPQPLAPGEYSVVLEPEAVGGLLAFLQGALDARSAEEGRSAFAKGKGKTRVGERMFAKTVTLRSDPTDPLTPGPTWVSDGLPFVPRSWIDRGLLTGLVYDRYWAGKQKVTPTGWPNVWHLLPGTEPDLVKKLERGVLVTRFWYIRTLDPQQLTATGLTRDGTFLVENGEIVGPVNNFRFNESPIRMLANLEAMSSQSVRTVDSGGSTRVPALLTHGFRFASVSDAV